MNYRLRTRSGLTLTEMTVVIATIALLFAIGLPAVRVLFNSFESESSATSMISAAIASARAIAAQNQRYAGIRFQKTNQNPDLLEAAQYMIFIVQDPKIGAYFFRAVEGLKPVKLPDSIGVMDLRIVTNRNDSAAYNEVPLDDPSLGGDARINEAFELADTSTFSVIFSSTGKLVIHRVQVRNRNGIPDTKKRLGDTSDDDVFNKKGDVDKQSPKLVEMGMGKEIGMFYQDDYFGVLDTPDYPDVPSRPDLGLGPEQSRSSFVIYEKNKFMQAYRKQRAWSDYLVKLAGKAIYINPYTGTIISR